jgi:hypothetical protein
MTPASNGRKAPASVWKRSRKGRRPIPSCRVQLRPSEGPGTAFPVVTQWSANPMCILQDK